jgi:hypothetical protein
MTETFIALAWILSGCGIVAWLAVGVAIARGVLATGPADVWRTRLLGLPVWLACGVGGFWGVGVHESVASNFAERDAAPVVSETTRSELRTPFIVRTSAFTRDQEGNLVASEERSVLQIPLVLVLFLGSFVVVRHRLQSRRIGPVVRGATLLLAALPLAGGCTSVDGVPDRPDRSFTEVQWDTLFLLESTLEDSLIFRVDRIAADADGFSVLDGVVPRVARFDWTGALLWYAGRGGGGPGELRQPRDLRMDDSGANWVLDVSARRISGFDAHGRLFQEVPLHDFSHTLDQFAVAPDARSFFAVVPEDGALQIIEFDRRGALLDASRIVLSRSGEPLAMALQGKIGSRPGDDRWTYAFTAGDGLFRFRRTTGLGPLSHFPDSVAFPELEEEITRSGASTSRTVRMVNRTDGAGAVAVWEDGVYIILLDEAGVFRLLDVYDLETGDYMETFRLPHGATSLAIMDGRLVLGYNAPHPTVLALRLPG